jgi:YD repeat-containing protein
LTVDFTGDAKGVSVLVLRAQPMNQANFNKLGQIASQLDSRGNGTLYTYDKFGRRDSVKHDGDEVNCCNDKGYGKTFYNRFGQSQATLAPDGKLIMFGYDKLGRQDSSYLGAIVDVPKGEYKLEGLPIGEEFNLYAVKTKTDVSNDKEKILLGDLTLIKEKTFKTTDTVLTGKLQTQADQIAIIRTLPIQRVERDFAGRIVAAYDAKNNQTPYYHDSLGRQIAVIQPPAGETNTRLANESYFDLSGNNIAQIIVPFDKNLKPIDQKKRITKIEYDQLGQATKIIQPHPTLQNTDGAEMRHEYGLLGNVIKTIDSLGGVTHFSHDNLGRKVSEKNAEGGVTKFTYDNVNRMRSLTDPINNTTSWSYNMLGRVSRERVVIDKTACIRFFYYDSEGNLIRKRDRNGRITEWTFDKMNRPTAEIWYENVTSWSQKRPSKKFTTTYNNRGKIESISGGDNKFAFSYGIFGNEIKQTQFLAGFSKPIEQNFVTDINGLKTEKSFSVDGKVDHAKKYEFDSLNRATNISQNVNDGKIKSLKINYDDFGQLSNQSRFDGEKPVVETKNKYDNAGRLINISHAGNQKTYADYDITWDNGNRIRDCLKLKLTTYFFYNELYSSILRGICISQY